MQQSGIGGGGRGSVRGGRGRGNSSGRGSARGSERGRGSSLKIANEWAMPSGGEDFDFEASAASLPPLRTSPPNPAKQLLTMEELEKGFGQVEIEESKQGYQIGEVKREVVGRVPSPFTEPPGLAEMVQKPVQLFIPPQVPVLWSSPSSPPPIITMPHPDAIGDREADEHAGLMSFYEQEGIRHIHVAQLTCDNPGAEDFYYLERVERENRQNESSVLYFPLPQPTARHRRRQEERAARRRERERERQEREKLGEVAPKVDQLAPNHSLLQGVLGRVQRSSSRKPRPLLQVPPGTRAIAQGSSLLLAELSEERLYLQVLSLAEKLLTLGEEDGGEVQAAATLLGLLSSESDELDRYLHVHLLGSHKGRRAMGHALRLLSPVLLDKWMERFMQTLEYLSLFSPQAEPSEAEHFIRTILSALVSHVALADWPHLCGWLEAFLSRPAFLWMAMNRAGLVLLCILLSRGEILKQEEEEDEEDGVISTGGSSEWQSLCNKLFESLSDRLVDFFPSSAPQGDYYVWQLMALLALSQEASESRRVMVVELRDRIMGVIEGGDALAIEHLNVFLNAIGLDASQLQ